MISAGYPQKLWITVSLSRHIATQPSVSYGVKLNWLKIGQLFLQDNFRFPETVDEAVERLMSVLEDEHKTVLAIMQEKDLIDLHFSLHLSVCSLSTELKIFNVSNSVKGR
jgi:hypothetical protein